MINAPLRRRAAAVTLSLSALLATAAAPGHVTPGHVASGRVAAGHGITGTGEHATSRAVPAVFGKAAARSCPQVPDRLQAAITRVDVNRITPRPAWRTTCETLYRSDSRPPETIFAQGFAPKDTVNGQYDIESYVLANQPSPYVSTTYDHDLYKDWYKSGHNYYIDAPGGVDVNKTIGNTHKYAAQEEVAFPGGIKTQYIIGVCPVDKSTKTEIMNECRSNPHYRPWH